MFARSTTRNIGLEADLMLERLEERIVLDGDVTWDPAADPDGVWHGVDTDGWDYYWYEDAGGDEYYFRYDDTGQWWKDSNDMWEGYPADDWDKFGDPSADSDFVYDGRWHDTGGGYWYAYNLVDQGYGYWWYDNSGTTYFCAYGYENGDWWWDQSGDADGDGKVGEGDWLELIDYDASDDFIYDGKWHKMGGGYWYAFNLMEQGYGYWWYDNSGTVYYCAYGYEHGDWWWDESQDQDGDGDPNDAAWLEFIRASDEPASEDFIYDGNWHFVHTPAGEMRYKFDAEYVGGYWDYSFEGIESYWYGYESQNWWEETSPGNWVQLWLQPDTWSPEWIVACQTPTDLDPADVHDLAELNGILYFAWDSPTYGVELYQYEPGVLCTGTAELAADINPSGSSDPEDMFAFDGDLYFSADDGTNGVELWRYDPDSDTAVMVEDIHPSGNSIPRYFVECDGDLYFSAGDGTNGVELWRYDPGTDTTEIAADVWDNGSSHPAYLTELWGTIYFAGTVDYDRELVAYNPFSDMITVVDVNPIGNSDPEQLMATSGNNLYFSAWDGTSGRELWRYSPGGTATRETDINTGSGSSEPRHITELDNHLYFSAFDGTERELWYFDLATTSYGLVADIRPGGESSNPAYLTVFDGDLYFQAYDGSNGTELWRYDPGTDTAELIANINPHDPGGNSNPRDFAICDGSLYFTAWNGLNGGDEIWRMRDMGGST